MYPVYCLTNRAFTKWGERYSKIEWCNYWATVLETCHLERIRKVHNIHSDNKLTLTHIVYWFDINILQQFPLTEQVDDSTLDVRMRIVCGMINKLISTDKIKYSDTFKQETINALQDTYRKFYNKWWDWYSINVLELPF